MQVSVVKRAPPAAQPQPAALSRRKAPLQRSAAAAAAATSESGRPAFVVPDSPPGDLNPKALERHLSYVDKLSKGMHVNDHIRNAKKFRNPCLLDKLVAMIGVQEFGSNYPTDLYDPNSLARGALRRARAAAKGVGGEAEAEIGGEGRVPIVRLAAAISGGAATESGGRGGGGCGRVGGVRGGHGRLCGAGKAKEQVGQRGRCEPAAAVILSLRKSAFNGSNSHLFFVDDPPTIERTSVTN